MVLLHDTPFTSKEYFCLVIQIFSNNSMHKRVIELEQKIQKGDNSKATRDRVMLFVHDTLSTCKEYFCQVIFNSHDA